MYININCKFRIKENEFIEMSAGDDPEWFVFFERKDGVVAMARYRAIEENGKVLRGDWLNSWRSDFSNIGEALNSISDMIPWHRVSKPLMELRMISEEARLREEAASLMRRTTGDFEDDHGDDSPF